MFTNEGLLDRLLRIALGVVVLMFVPQTAWAWLGLAPLITGALGYCPLYHALGWSTCHKPGVA